MGKFVITVPTENEMKITDVAILQFLMQKLFQTFVLNGL